MQQDSLREYYENGDNFTPTSVNTDMSAWVSPDGKFYNVPQYSHSMFAAFFMGTTVDRLESMGWMHISGINFFIRTKVSQNQIDTLYDLYSALKNEEGWRYERICEIIMNIINSGEGTRY